MDGCYPKELLDSISVSKISCHEQRVEKTESYSELLKVEHCLRQLETPQKSLHHRTVQVKLDSQQAE